MPLNALSDEVLRENNQFLAIGNSALRMGHHVDAINAYCAAFQKFPSLLRWVEFNIQFIHKQVKNSASKAQDSIAICLNGLNDLATIERVMCVAKMYKEKNYNVEIINISSNLEDDALKLIDGISVVQFQFKNADLIDNTMLSFAYDKAYSIMHLISPTPISILMASFHKLASGNSVFVDLNEQSVSALNDLFPIAHKFDGVTVDSSSTQISIGGSLLSSLSDMNALLRNRKSEFNLKANASPSFLLETQSVIESILFISGEEQIDNSVSADLVRHWQAKEELRRGINLIKNLAYDEIEPIQSAARIFFNKSNQDFINSLYIVALKRKCDDRELLHYCNLLDSNQKNRLEITNIIFTSEECKRIYSNQKLKYLVRKEFDYPELGTISPKDIKIPLFANPLVTVLIPHYCKVEYTLNCLKSISDFLPTVTFEVLVLDDLSPDSSLKILKKVKNIRVIQNPTNLGFTKSCNYGSAFAKGEYLFFLNSDTQVKEGWLDALIDTFRIFPKCGIAGSKLLYPDGRLQEAGCIIWRGQAIWNYGRDDDPNRPEYNYLREVDYCSGAAILIKKDLFFELGCFDEQYAPAYCEDTDLCLAVRSAGYSVIYQPFSEVIHYEGISNGTDLKSGIKAYQEINIKKLYAKWKKIINTHGESGINPQLERDRGASGRILFVDASTPTPDKDSGSVDIYNLMILFRAMGFAVTFIPEDNFLYLDGYTQNLQRRGIQVIYAPYFNSVEAYVSHFGDFYDVVMLFRPGVATKVLHLLRDQLKQAKLIYNTVDLHFLRFEREAIVSNQPEIMQESIRSKEIELNLIKLADLSTVVSSYEYDLLKGIDPSLKIAHLPYSRGLANAISPFKKRDGLLFVGGFQHTPNVDAIRFFCTEIYPLILNKIPNCILHVVGSNCPDEVLQLQSENIKVHGFVEDLASILQSVKVNLVPLRYGAGIKGKLGGAMAAGLPSVSTTLGVEGMALKDGDDGVFIADDLQLFANYVVNLTADEALWKRSSEASLQFAEFNFGAKKLYDNVVEVFDHLGISLPEIADDVVII